jgi:hypothetical protein
MRIDHMRIDHMRIDHMRIDQAIEKAGSAALILLSPRVQGKGSAG